MGIFQLSQLPEVRWRNEGGWTREIGSGVFATAAREAQEPWDWRLSVASIIKDGDFSTFPRVDRIAGLVDGAITLESSSSRMSWSAQGDMHPFAGEPLFRASLRSGTARFFNVMTRRGHAVAEMRVHRTDFTLAVAMSEVVCLLTLAGTFRMQCAAGATSLSADEGMLINDERPPARVTMSSTSGCLLEARVRSARRSEPEAST